MYVHPVPVQDEKTNYQSAFVVQKRELKDPTLQKNKHFYTTVNLKWHDSLVICPEYELEIWLLKSGN